MDLSILSRQFCEESALMRGYSPDTIKRYKTAVHLFSKHAAVTDIAECTQEKVREYFFRGRGQRHWSAGTFLTYHKSLVVFFRWCADRGHLERNPAEGIGLPKCPKTLPCRLIQQDALRLLEIVQNYPWAYTFLRFRNAAILAVVIFAGLRKQELLGLQVVDVDIVNRTIFVRRGKGAKDRIVPMSGALVPYLASYAAERTRLGKTCPEFFTSLNRDLGLTDTGLRRMVVQAREVSGIAFSLHKLRHTFATLMLEGGCDIFSLSRMMGHSEIKTTTIYLSASAEHLRAQMAKHPLSQIR
jgi:site-specific recombinase XerD